MKLKVGYETGYVNCGQDEVLEIPDEELKGLDDEDKEDLFEEYAREWFYERCSFYFSEVE